MLGQQKEGQVLLYYISSSFRSSLFPMPSVPSRIFPAEFKYSLLRAAEVSALPKTLLSFPFQLLRGALLQPQPAEVLPSDTAPSSEGGLQPPNHAIAGVSPPIPSKLL